MPFHLDVTSSAAAWAKGPYPDEDDEEDALSDLGASAGEAYVLASRTGSVGSRRVSSIVLYSERILYESAALLRCLKSDAPWFRVLHRYLTSNPGSPVSEARLWA